MADDELSIDQDVSGEYQGSDDTVAKLDLAGVGEESLQERERLAKGEGDWSRT